MPLIDRRRFRRTFAVSLSWGIETDIAHAAAVVGHIMMHQHDIAVSTKISSPIRRSKHLESQRR